MLGGSQLASSLLVNLLLEDSNLLVELLVFSNEFQVSLGSYFC
jgi:hypothetical protein